MDGEWTIRELQLYTTPDCSGTRIPKLGTIPSGANTIADGDTGTWWLGCNPCHPHKEYVGLHTALTVVRCLKLWQCARTGCVDVLPLPSVAEDSSLSAGAVAGIAGGGTVLAGLVLAIIVISVHVCRKMNRELKQVKKPASETPEPPVPAVQGKTRQADIQLA